MAKVKYVGQYESVMVPALGGRDVAHGEVVEVDDELAASLGEQAGNWELVDAGKPEGGKAGKQTAAPVEDAEPADDAPADTGG